MARFFSDDQCLEELPKDDPITSGHLYDTSSLSSADLYGPAKAFDGKDEDEPGNIFAANCRVDRGDILATCRPGFEWIGLRFQERQEVKCVTRFFPTRCESSRVSQH